jgi:hypothetical protein
MLLQPGLSAAERFGDSFGLKIIARRYSLLRV